MLASESGSLPARVPLSQHSEDSRKSYGLHLYHRSSGVTFSSLTKNDTRLLSYKEISHFFGSALGRSTFVS